MCNLGARVKGIWIFKYTHLKIDCKIDIQQNVCLVFVLQLFWKQLKYAEKLQKNTTDNLCPLLGFIAY